MRRSRTKWVSGIGAVVLAGGLWMTGSGSGVTPAGAEAPLILPGVTQNWDKNLPSVSRFTVLDKFNNQAVRDNTTGLVWEQAPDGTPRTWALATSYCVNQEIGGTAGWRLPSVVELKSVQDGSTGAVAPFVPAPPFTISTSNTTPGVQSAFYWSATTLADNPPNAWFVRFDNGDVFSSSKASSIHAWCVRGGMNADAY
jgi:hypothetical protein